MPAGQSAPPRVIAVVGPYKSGKTSLAAALLNRFDDNARSPTWKRASFDTDVAAGPLDMGVDLNTAALRFMGEDYILLDCPGSIEFMAECEAPIRAADCVIVVAEPEATKAQALAPLLHRLEAEKIPHLLFLNKIDKSELPVSDMMEALGQISRIPVVLRHWPVMGADGKRGYVDLAPRRGYLYSEDGKSIAADIPKDQLEQVEDERFRLLETLADYHDHLLEELLEDIEPPVEEVYSDLAADLADALIMPVVLGSAESGGGLLRLLKLLRHEVPAGGAMDRHLFLPSDSEPAAFVVKVSHEPHAGRSVLVRVASGPVKDGITLGGERIASMEKLTGEMTQAGNSRGGRAYVGDMVRLQRFDGGMAGEMLGAQPVDWPVEEKADTVYEQALDVESEKDDAKLSECLAKLVDEYPGYSVNQNMDTGELVLAGQGDIHMRAAKLRLQHKYGVEVVMRQPKVPYKETIRKSGEHHSRFKKQTGGHGQFGDVVIEVQPLALGQGITFNSAITGGAIPKQYIPSVEAGVRDSFTNGPLGFPVVDVGVTLKDGSHHAVDSSDIAFRTAGRMAASAALPDCDPVLLEPIEKVQILAPSHYTAKVTALASSRRGQILGFDARQDWPGWDCVEALIPQSEMGDMIIELRSLTQGTGTFHHSFDHLSELSGREKQRVLKISERDTPERRA